MYWYLDIQYRKVCGAYDAVIRISKAAQGLDPPERDAGTIVRNYNRESNKDQEHLGTLQENKGELNKDMKKRK